MIAKVDYLGATFPQHWGIETCMIVLLGTTDWERRKTGFRNYDNSWQNGSIRLCEGGQPGIHVDIPGEGCRQLDANDGQDWQERLQTMSDMGVHFTRIDFAVDEKEGLINLDEVEGAIRNKTVVTHSRKCRSIRSWDMDRDDEDDGRTVYMGSEQSETVVRFYNKAVEQSKSGHWMRCELQLRQKRANAAVRALLKEGMGAIARILAQVVSFRQVTGKSRMTNEPIAEWWSRFIEGAAGLKLQIDATVKTWQEKAEWFKQCMAPFVAMLRQCGITCEEMETWVVEGALRLSHQQRMLLQAGGFR